MKNSRPEVIAEIGFNHEGDMDLGIEMIKEAANAGVDIVKFQSYKAIDIALPSSEHFAAIESGAIDAEQHKILFDAAEEYNVEFMSTPFGVWAVELLEKLGVKRYKIASMDATNYVLLEEVAKTKKPLIISTGMCTLAEIFQIKEFLDKKNSGEVTFLHCISKYPASEDELDLNVIATLKNKLDLPIGYSDHTYDINACLLSAALGATTIEKHFTLDRTLDGADHYHSANPIMMKRLVEGLKKQSSMLGCGDFNRRSDISNSDSLRRGIYVKHDLAVGDTLTMDDLIFCRPETVINPTNLELVLNKKIKEPLKSLDPLRI